ncbi:DUF397 domain-containing protein [Streptomyces lanatus]|uniref:DUF397 domain-containing protein n=1 Tax=Streptomyces lanatus TaxID=66900 RepID=A0ABV1XV96_9ACTN|nr:DUF397 domain-containing protein [Streptomyces lanatus]GHH13212.1 hypothetical protein GCM10018780_52670 [Streptomyces lanatus]
MKRSKGIDLDSAAWRRSSYSNSQAGECVEVAHLPGAAVPVRDSKNPDGPALLFPTPAWDAFIRSL